MYLEVGIAGGSVRIDEKDLRTSPTPILESLEYPERNCVGVSRKAED